jgi:hypothetical protein
MMVADDVFPGKRPRRQEQLARQYSSALALRYGARKGANYAS